MKNTNTVSSASGPSGRWRGLLPTGVQFLLLFALWLAFSGRLEAKELVTGAVAVGLVTVLSRGLLRPEGEGHLLAGISWGRAVAYLGWLFLAIVKANIQVAYLALHPRMPVDPALLVFRTPLRRGLARVALANSITLTPGTVTVDLTDGRYVVHALVPSSADSLVSGKMQSRVARVFGEEAQEGPSARWVHSIRALEP